MAKKKSKPRRTDDEYDYFPSRPIKAVGGIESRSRRGAFAANWWAKRWLAVLESYGIGSRLQRGRSYARGGQVLKIDVQPGSVQARVQGSRPQPYQIAIEVKPLTHAEWERVLDTISSQAIFAAELLDGMMPQGIESAFETAHISLFPQDPRDLRTDCTCPDDSNPCKHIAAVYYLLGEQFDTDPFLIFSLRGRTREQVIEALRARRAAAARENSEQEPSVETFPSVPALVDQIADFWGSEVLAWTSPVIAAPEINAAMLSLFGNEILGDLKKSLEALYEVMTFQVQGQILGDEEGAVRTT